MKKKIFLTFSILVVIFILLAIVAYLNKPFILNKAKTILLENIESSTGRTARIGKIDYNFLRGFVINDLEIDQESPDEKSPFIKIKEISFNPVIFPFILKKDIFIPSININGLSVNIVRTTKDYWNFSDIVESLGSRLKTKSKFSFTILKARITDSEVLFQDNSLASPFLKKFKNLSLTLKPYLPTSASFDLKTSIEKEESQIAFMGKINFLTKQATASIDLENLFFSDYLVYFDNLPFSIKEGRLSTKLFCDYKNESLYLAGLSSISKSKIIKDNLEIQTDLSFKLKIDYDFKNPEKPLNYAALISVSNAKISGLPYLKEISEITGGIKLSVDKLIFDKINGASLFGPLTLSGNLENFQNPQIDVKINADIAIAKLKESFALQGFEAEGNADTELTVKGPLSSPKNLDFKGRANISKAKFNAKYLLEAISDIQTAIYFDKTTISWQDLKASFKQETYTSSGSSENFFTPHVKLNLSSNKLNLEGELGINNKILNISKLDGSLFNSKFDIKGDIDLSNINNPLGNLNANVKIELKDLGNINKNLKDTLDKIQLSGIMDTQMMLMGNLKNYLNWQLNLNGKSEFISLYGLNIKDVTLNYSQTNSPLANIEFVAKPYSGELSIKNQIDLAKENMPFLLKVNLNGIDISLLKNDTPLKDKEISGKLFCDVSLNGLSKDINNSLSGLGSLQIKEGNLWQLELLKGLGEFLLIPEFQKINFKEAAGDFLIENNKISTEDFTLSSEPLNMLLEGNIDFAGNIDFKVTTQLTEGLIKGATDLRGIFSSILAQSTNAIIIKLSGTVKEPKYKIIPLPGEIFKKAKDFIFQEVLP